MERKYGTSFFLLDVQKLRENYRKIEYAFKSRYQNFIIGYSYKTNYLPYLCKELSKIGAYAEVVSRLEYDLALKIGVDPKSIIFNGPIKNMNDINLAFENESILNIDSLYEVDLIKEYCAANENKQIKVGLRANFSLSKGGESPLQEGYETSRFGICVENGNFEYVINELKMISNVKITGLHGHFSTKTRSVETYQTITKKLCDLVIQYIPDTVEYIDIGGGIYGELPQSFRVNAPGFEDYAEAICLIVNEEFKHFVKKPFLVLEPGISMVANTFLFITKVIDVKKVNNTNFVLVDGSVHNIKPTMHKRNLPMQTVKAIENFTEDGIYQIVGYTCMEKDYLAHDIAGEVPSRNDYFIFENVGAYTIVFNPPFIKERPAIIAYDGKKTFIVRKKETIKEFFNEDIYCF
ncbi:diaminopimelate decarboxylase [Ferdinandcohnia sp. Marseille-Q9671]